LTRNSNIGICNISPKGVLEMTNYSVTRINDTKTVLEQPAKNVTVFPSSTPTSYTPDQLLWVGRQGILLGVRNPNFVTIIPPVVDIQKFIETAKTVSRHGPTTGDLLGLPVVYESEGQIWIAIYTDVNRKHCEWVIVPSSDPYWKFNEVLQLVYHGPDPMGAKLEMPQISTDDNKYVINENGQIINSKFANLTTVPERPPYLSNPIQAKPQVVREAIPTPIAVQSTTPEPVVAHTRMRTEPIAQAKPPLVERTQVVSPGFNSRNNNTPPPANRTEYREEQGGQGSNLWKWAIGVVAIISISSTLGWLVSHSNANKDSLQQQRTEIVAAKETNNSQQKTIEDLKVSVEDLKTKNTQISALNTDIERLNQDVRDLRNQEKKLTPDMSTRVIQERTNLEQQLADLKDQVSKQTLNASDIQKQLANLKLPNQKDFEKLSEELETQTKAIQETFDSTQAQFKTVDSSMKKLGKQFQDFQTEWEAAKPKIAELQAKTDQVGKKVDETLKSITDFINKQYEENNNKK
jgi:predicted  nucleic acid-binding Zn-ribbon protein